MIIYARIFLYSIIFGLLMFNIASCSNNTQSNNKIYSGYKLLTYKETLKNLNYILESIEESKDPYELISKTKTSLSIIATIINNNNKQDNSTSKDKVKQSLQFIKKTNKIPICNCFSNASINDIKKCSNEISDNIYALLVNLDKPNLQLQSKVIDIKVITSNITPKNYNKQFKRLLNNFTELIKELHKHGLISSKPLKSKS